MLEGALMSGEMVGPVEKPKDTSLQKFVKEIDYLGKSFYRYRSKDTFLGGWKYS